VWGWDDVRVAMREFITSVTRRCLAGGCVWEVGVHAQRHRSQPPHIRRLVHPGSVVRVDPVEAVHVEGCDGLGRVVQSAPSALRCAAADEE
jgi:hypothetical protein